jgi:hypothetical protein
VTPVQKTQRVEELRNELLEVVRRLLWDRSMPIARSRRIALQGKWLFDSVFLREAQNSVVRGDARVVRWLRLLGLTLRHPKMLLSPIFRNHVCGNAGQLVSRGESVSGNTSR